MHNSSVVWVFGVTLAIVSVVCQYRSVLGRLLHVDLISHRDYFLNRPGKNSIIVTVYLHLCSSCYSVSLCYVQLVSIVLSAIKHETTNPIFVCHMSVP